MAPTARSSRSSATRPEPPIGATTSCSLSASRQLTWNDGDTSPRTITVRANTDALDEGTETFDFLLASEGDNFDQSGTVTIVDVPPASTGLATFVEPVAEVFEGENLELVVERSGGSDGALNATLAVDNDTASGADYRVDPPVGGTLSWAAGDTSSRTVTVRALADTVIDPDEQFTLVLTSDGDDDSDQTSAVSIVDVPPARVRPRRLRTRRLRPRRGHHGRRHRQPCRRRGRRARRRHRHRGRLRRRRRLRDRLAVGRRAALGRRRRRSSRHHDPCSRRRRRRGRPGLRPAAVERRRRRVRPAQQDHRLRHHAPLPRPASPRSPPPGGRSTRAPRSTSRSPGPAARAVLSRSTSST